MKYLKHIFLLFSLAWLIEGQAQEISVQPSGKIDSVWYSNVTEESEPDPMSCEENSIGYFRLKFSTEIVIDDFKKDTITTKKEDWEEADEKEFDQKYNEEKRKELEALEDEFLDEDEDIRDLSLEEIQRFVEVNWNGYGYNICKPDCESVMEACYIYHEITQLKDAKKTYKYRTNFSWLNENEEADNTVEIDFDLVISYETWIYFFVTCSCDEIPDLISVPSKQLNEGNPWAYIDLIGERMKPGYPFVMENSSLPILPVVGGLIGGGALVYVLTQGDDENSCDFVVNTNTKNTLCGDASGSAQILVSPAGDYQYTWSTGQNSASVTGLMAGNYSVTISPIEQDCPKIISITIGDDSESPGSIVSTSNADCGIDNGSAVIENAAEGQSYLWSDGSMESMVNDLAVGSHTVTISQGSCTEIVDFLIDENPADFQIVVDEIRPTCGQQDGSITLNVEPALTYNFEWSSGQNGASISKVESGTYTVTITQANTSCSVVESIFLEDLPADYTLSFVATVATCGNADGSISVHIDEPGDYIYMWSNGQTTASISDIPAGEYYITVTSNGTECVVTENFTLEEEPFPLDIEFTHTMAHCGLSDGSISLQLSPDGMYTYDWSNGQTNRDLEDIGNGNYSVTVTDQNGCTASATTVLESEEVEHIKFVEAVPGDCIHSGEINIMLITPGDGPLAVEIIGSESQGIFQLEEGLQGLSDNIDLPPGIYTIIVYDVGAGSECSQTVEVEVEDSTPVIMAGDDQYEAFNGTALTENVLLNDEGLEIFVQSFSDWVGGSVTVDSDGNFTFTPDDDFVGEASFQYILEDACGHTDTALVVITIQEVECTFTTLFDITPATCGFEDGVAIALVDPPGDYSYLWSDGTVGAELIAGESTYGLTITDNELGCNLSYEVIIPSNEPSYVSNIFVLQPSCKVGAEVHFEIGGTMGPFLMTVTSPFSIEEYLVPQGIVLLSDYQAIVPGEYFIDVYDINAGPECSETFSVFIEEAAGLVIEVVSVIPPSSISANDGAIVVLVTGPGTLPYAIWLNDDGWGEAIDNEFIIDGLSVGDYSLFITDTEGCTSNVVEVFIPPPMTSDIELGFGGLLYFSDLDEPSSAQSDIQISTLLQLSVSFETLGMRNTTSLGLIQNRENAHWMMTSTMDLGRWSWSKIDFRLKGGGVTTKNVQGNLDAHWMLELSGNFFLNDLIRAEITINRSPLISNGFIVGCQFETSLFDRVKRQKFNPSKALLY